MPDWRAWADKLDDHQPIYQQIIDCFKSSVINNEMQPGHRMPSIRDVATAMRVTTNTAHRAYLEMEREGLIYSQRGTGYFVSEDVTKMTSLKADMARGAIARFMQDMRSMGYTNEQILVDLTREMERLTAEEGGNG